MPKIRFKELSIPIKIAVVFSYIMLGLYVFSFLIGFMLGVLSYLV